MALIVLKKLDGNDKDLYVQQCLKDLALPRRLMTSLEREKYLEMRLAEAQQHLNSGKPAEDSSYAKQLDFLNNRIAELGIEEHSRLMLPPVVFSDPNVRKESVFYTLSSGYRLINNNPINLEDNHIHEMTHAASRLKIIFKASENSTTILSMNGFTLTRNYKTSFAIFNEFAAISMEEDYRKKSGAFFESKTISNSPALNEEEKKELLALSRLVDAEGIPGLKGRLKGIFRRLVKRQDDYSMDYTATVLNNTWRHSDYLAVYTAMNRMLLEVGARKLGLKHKYELSEKQEITILSNHKDEIQKAVFTGSIKKVAKDFKDTFGHRGLHFLSDVKLNSSSNQAHIYLVILFARAGHIQDPERRNSVREKIMDHYYNSKKLTN